MKESISISIPKDIKRALDKEGKAEGISRSAVVVEALKKYLGVRKIESIRSKMIPKARSQGIYTDEDVFARLS
jgi:metal-responsive CopG/Arc/MetJ family transcriptional regulator